MSSDTGPLTLSREDLYELVWSKPMVELAKDFGLSDVALAKRCRKLGVPVPGRGYWARVAAGQTPRQAALKKRKEESIDDYRLQFDAPRAKSNEDSKPPVPPKLPEYNARRDQILLLKIPPSDDLQTASGAYKRTGLHLKRPWRAEISWVRGERTGPIFQVSVAEGSEDRALRISEQLIQGAILLGWSFVEAPAKEEERSRHYGYGVAAQPSTPAFGVLKVEGEFFSFRIDERRRQIDHVLTEEEKQKKRRGDYYYAPRFDHLPTGELRLHCWLKESSYTTRIWKDGKKARIEDQLNAVLSSLLEQSIEAKVRREDARLAEIRRRREQELAWKQSQRRDENRKLIHELESQAGAWFRARMLKSYLRAVRRTLGAQSLQSRLGNQPVDFLKWAEYYADQLDPLSSTPHHLDLMENSDIYYRFDESKLQESLSRLLGREWQRAWKHGPSSEDGQGEASFVDDDDDRDREDDGADSATGLTGRIRPTDDEEEAPETGS